MIPKIIHYVWFGGKPYPKKIKKCINSWKKFLPDYKFIQWDESNFDINCCEFTKQAYENKKWAFVSDVARIKALEEYGGWYLDTDVEVLRPLSQFEDNELVFGTDENGSLTAVYGSTAHHPVWEEILSEYQKTSFIQDGGNLNQEVVNHYIERALRKYGFVIENKYQNLGEGIEVFPDDYFHVASLETGEKHLTENSACIHWQTMLWTPRTSRMFRWIRLHIMKPLFGERFLDIYSNISNKIKHIFNK